jgi:hypothetical protein
MSEQINLRESSISSHQVNIYVYQSTLHVADYLVSV